MGRKAIEASNNSRIAVVLTATVAPSVDMPNLVIRDSSTRQGQYLRAIDWWSRVCGSQGWDLCVVENSGNLELLQSKAPRDVRWLAVEPQGVESLARGKGAGEAHMLLKASQHWNHFDFLIKVTGRLRILNIVSLVRSVDLQCPTSLVVYPGSEFPRLDTRVFIAAPRALEAWMATAAPLVRDEVGNDLEAVSTRWIVNDAPPKWKVATFRRTPAFVGVSGTTGLAFSPIRASVRAFLESLLRARLSR